MCDVDSGGKRNKRVTKRKCRICFFPQFVAAVERVNVLRRHLCVLCMASAPMAVGLEGLENVCYRA